MPQFVLSAVVCALVVCMAAPASARRHRHVDDSDTVTLDGNTHPRAFRDMPTGAADPSLRMEHMVLSLKIDGAKEGKLHDLLSRQQDPADPQYHRWITPEQFRSQFGQNQENVAAVTDWLKSHGFTVEEVSKSGTSITFSGTAGEVRRAFHTSIYEYRDNGRVHHANSCDPSIPRELADLVDGVVSLHNFRRKPLHTEAKPLAQSGTEFTSGSSHYLSPADFATIYNVNPLYQAGIDGTGQTIAIVGRTHPPSSNWSAFRSAMGLPAKAVEVIVNGADPGSLGGVEDLEADLDVEWAGAVAKNATIKFVTSKSTNTTDGVDLSASYIVNNNLAPVMSVSFGQCETYMGATENAFYNNLWKQAAAQGITVFVASGDSGAAGCDASSASTGTVAAVSGMASTPYNVAVGGSQFNEGGGSYWSGSNTGYSSALGYIPEKAWNESSSGGLMATGGGVSSLYAKPAWQTAPGVPNDGRRSVPDVSLTASGHDGYLIYSGGGLTSCGGTSAASPAFAGLMALVVQATGQRQGNANLRFYELANEQMNSGGAAVFHDIVSGSNSVPGVAGFPAGSGYDLATGLGSVDAAAMVHNWQQNSQSSDPLVIASFSVPALSKSTLVPVTGWTTSGSGTVAGYLITTSSSVPAATAAGWSAAVPASFNTVTAGTKTLYAWIKNGYGAVSSPASATVNVDLTAPTVTGFSSAPVSRSATIAVSLSATDDNSGVSGYAVTESTTAPAATSPLWSTPAPTSYTAATASGTKTLYAWAKDAAGNVSKALKAVTVMDTAAPVVSAFKVPTAANTLTVAISGFSATDNLKVTGFQVTESDSAPALDDPLWSATYPASYTFASPGVKTLYPWARDAAGNVSQPKAVAVQIDTSAPAVSSFAVAPVSSTLAASVTSFSASDDVKVSGYLITESAEAPAASDARWSARLPTAFTFKTAGAKTLYAWAKDAVGNVSASASATTLVDITKPIVTSFAVPSVGNSLTLSVTDFAATDNVAVTGYLVTESATAPLPTNSGWSATPQGSYTFASPGVKTLRAWARDSAGNVAVAKMATTTVDLTLPLVGSFTLPAAVNSLTVPIKALAATDAVKVAGYLVGESADAPAVSDSHWSASAPTSFTFASQGTKTLYAWAKDSAGNISTARSATVVVDTTVPAVESFTLPAYSKTLSVAVGSFAATDDVKVAAYLITESAAAPDAGNKLWKAVPPTSYAFLSQGTKTLYAWAKDSAGNISPSRSAAVVVDTSVPAVGSFTVPTTSASLTVTITAFAATDNVAVAAYLVTESATKPLPADGRWSSAPPADYTFASQGSKTLYSWAKDDAGNVSAAKSAVTLVDTTAPVVKSFTVPAKSNSLTVPISGVSIADNFRISAYLVTESSVTPAAGDSGWSSTAPKSYSFSSPGEKTLYYWIKDSAGNVSAPKGMASTITS